MILTLQGASARRHPRVPHSNERRIIWVLAERPLTDSSGRFLRVVIDVDGRVCWPEWRKAYCDSVELMSPEQYPPRVQTVPDPPRMVCAKCGRTFRVGSSRAVHERVCGREQPATLRGQRSETLPGVGYWGQPKQRKKKGQVAAAAVLCLLLGGCGPPAITFQSPGNEIQRAQDRAWAEQVTDRLNFITHCLDVQTRECMATEARKQKDGE